jgi:uncharacterized membrane protein
MILVGKIRISTRKKPIISTRKQLKFFCVIFCYFLFYILISSTLFGVVNAATISGNIYDLALQKEYDVVVEINTIPRQVLVSKDGYYTFNINPGTYKLYAYTEASESLESIVVTDDGDYVFDIVLGNRMPESLREVLLLDSIIGDYDIDVSSSIPGSNISTNDYAEQFVSTKLLWRILGLILLILLFIVALVVLALLVSKKFLLTKRILSKSEFVKKVLLKSEHNSSEYAEYEHDSSKYNSSKYNSDTASKDIVIDEYEFKVLTIIKKEKRTTQKDIRKAIPLSEAKISLILTDLESQGKIRKIKKGRGNVLIFVKD